MRCREHIADPVGVEKKRKEKPGAVERAEPRRGGRLAHRRTNRPAAAKQLEGIFLEDCALH